MKHLIIIISILLFSNPVIGNKQKGETLYVLGEYPEWKWVEFGDKETLAEGLGAGPESDPDPPPPPPQETVKVNKKSKTNILIFIQRLLIKFYTVKLLLIFLIARVFIDAKLLVSLKI